MIKLYFPMYARAIFYEKGKKGMTLNKQFPRPEGLKPFTSHLSPRVTKDLGEER